MRGDIHMARRVKRVSFGGYRSETGEDRGVKRTTVYMLVEWRGALCAYMLFAYVIVEHGKCFACCQSCPDPDPEDRR